MKGFVDANSIANTVRMVRTSNGLKSAILVEGYKDVRLYSNLFDAQKCFITPAMNKMNAVSALRVLHKGGVKGVFTIIDSDFSTLIGPAWDNPDILLTDTHDLEGMLLRSQALEKLAVEHEIDMHSETDLRAKLLLATRQLGYLRLASERGTHRLNFENLNHANFIDARKISCDVQRMTSEVIEKSLNSRMSSAEMIDAISEIEHARHDPWIISSGHDLAAVLALVLSNRTGKEILSYTVERQLRLAYERAFFRQTALYSRIVAWQQLNQPFRVF